MKKAKLELVVKGGYQIVTPNSPKKVIKSEKWGTVVSNYLERKK